MRHLFPTLLLGLVQAVGAAGPIADIHLHYKENQKEVTSARRAAEILRDNQVELAVVMGRPPELALELAAEAPERVIPLYGVYPVPGFWSHWHRDKTLLQRTRAALASGKYRGIGEVHMIGGFISSWKNPRIGGLFDLAAEFDVPILVHTEFSRANYVIGFCQAHPKTRFLWSHAGSILRPAEVRRAMLTCPNLHAELAARDPWRHTGRPIHTKAGKLQPAWRKLVIDFADRFMVGSDPVWPVDRLNPWDEPDTGWEKVGDFLDFHRGWLADLPTKVADKVRVENAREFFRKKPVGAGSARDSK